MMSIEALFNKFSLIWGFEKVGVVQKGEFLLKSGKTSDTYIDLKKLISYPYLLKGVCEALHNKIEEHSITTKDKNYVICGVPMGAIPYAVGIGITYNIPAIMIRDVVKDYGTKKVFEGDFDKDASIILIEDVITTGSSVCKILDIFEQHKLKVALILCIVNRGEGGIKKITERGYNVDYIIDVTDL